MLRRPAPAPRVAATRITRLVRDPRAWLALYTVTLAAIAFWPTPVDKDAGPLLAAIARLFPALTYERIEFVANISLFVPLGLLLTLILTRSRWLVLPIAFLATVTIECGQALLLDARTPSILDIVANTAGACLGIVLAAFIEWLARSRMTLDGT
ncbi:MAG TPA: VanZ family protein [Microbacterium sp.]|nr:VanZ family protein [Microbacterium sp.]